MSPRSLVAVLLVTVLASAGCSSLADPPALTVNGVDISARSVDGELTALEDNADYRSIAENDCGGPAAGQGKGTFASACVARLLTLRAYYELVDQELARRGRTISGDDLLAAREQLEGDLTPQGSNKSALGGFGKDLQDRLVRRYALIAALQDEVAGQDTGEAAQRAYYEANKGQFEQACVSHILASTDAQSPEQAKAKIDAIAARIAGGESFAAIATNENDDTVAAAKAGSLDCGPRGRFAKAFDDAAFSLPVGQLSAPVQTEFGWHLILVTSRETATFEQVQPQVQQQLQQQASGAIGTVLSKITCDAKVSVDPRFGRWDDAACGGTSGQVARVVPPEGPVSTDTSLTPLP